MNPSKYKLLLFKALFVLFLLILLLLFLMRPRTSAETYSLEDLPSELWQQQLEPMVETDSTENDSVVFGPVSIVTRSNLLGWSETIYLIPVAKLETANIRPGGNEIDSFSLQLLSIRADLDESDKGRIESLSITLDPGEYVSVRGAFDVTAACGKTIWSERTFSLSFLECPITELQVFYTSGGVEDERITADTTSKAWVQFQFDLTYDGVTVAQDLTLTAEAEYLIYGL